MTKLCKSATDRKIAGVCGGIAEYLNCDPTIIRLAFAALVLGAGTGLLAYIVAAVIMPEPEAAETVSSREEEEPETFGSENSTYYNVR